MICFPVSFSRRTQLCVHIISLVLNDVFCLHPELLISSVTRRHLLSFLDEPG